MQVRVKTEFEVSFTLNETEMKALDALAGYGADQFLKVFYEKMGKHYLEPHEAGLRSLFAKALKLRPSIQQVDNYKRNAKNFCVKA